MIFDPAIFDGVIFDTGDVIVAQVGGSSKRRPRRWKTTEEIVEELRAERAFRYVPAPVEPKPFPMELRNDLDYDAISKRVAEELIKRQARIDRAKRKKAAVMMLLKL